MNINQLKKMYDFKDETVVVTGGAGELGGEIACALVGCNANVAIIDRSPQLAERLVHRFDPAGGRAIIVYGDVLNPEIMEEAAHRITREFGQIDALVNGAGGNNPQATTSADQSFFDLPSAAFRFVFDLNLVGTIIPSQIFGKYMAEQGSGNILNLLSTSAFQPPTGIPAYSAAKAGVSNFTQWLAVHMAREYSPQIRVNAIAPGFIQTQQNSAVVTDEKSGKLTSRGRSILDHTPLGRFGRPEDLLGAVLWLLSPAAAFVTGVVVPIDGGFSAFSGV